MEKNNESMYESFCLLIVDEYIFNPHEVLTLYVGSHIKTQVKTMT